MKENKKIKILFTEPVSDMGGVSYFILKIVELLPLNKFEIHFAADGEGKMFSEAKKFNVEGHSLPLDYNSVFSFWRAVKAERKFIKDEEFNVIHSHTAKAGFLCVVAGFGLSHKHIYTGHGWRYRQKKNLIKKVIMYCFESFIIRNVDTATLLSQKEYDQGIQAGMLKKDRSAVIPLSFNVPTSILHKNDFRLKVRKDFLIGENSILVVMVGRMVFQKDPETFVKVLSEIYYKMPSVHFVWIGNGELHEEVLKMAHSLGVSDRFHITGVINNTAVADILLGCDLMLFTSRFEGLPISILEAMANCLPVLSADVGSISDVIIDKKTGRLFKSGDFLEASNTTYELLNNKGSLDKYAQTAFDYFKLNYTPKEKMPRAFAQLYFGVLHK